MTAKKNEKDSKEISAPSSLRDHGFPESFDTSESDVVYHLYLPAMRAAVRYDRGVGYFTSGWLTCVAEGLAALAENGGRMRLITSTPSTHLQFIRREIRSRQLGGEEAVR